MRIFPSRYIHFSCGYMSESGGEEETCETKTHHLMLDGDSIPQFLFFLSMQQLTVYIIFHRGDGGPGRPRSPPPFNDRAEGTNGAPRPDPRTRGGFGTPRIHLPGRPRRWAAMASCPARNSWQTAVRPCTCVANSAMLLAKSGFPRATSEIPELSGILD